MVIHRITLTIGICLTALGLLIGCTRNRATPEPVASEAGPEITVLTTTQGSGEPVVTLARICSRLMTAQSRLCPSE